MICIYNNTRFSIVGCIQMIDCGIFMCTHVLSCIFHDLPFDLPVPVHAIVVTYSISQVICTRFCCALLCCGYAIVHNEFTWSIYPYSSGCFAGTGAIVRLPQCQWSKPDGYGKISQCIITTKHSKAKTVCIFLGIYCILCIHDTYEYTVTATLLESCSCLHLLTTCIVFLNIGTKPFL